MNFLTNLFAILIAKFAAWLFDKSLVLFEEKLQREKTENQIDRDLENLEHAYKEAINGQPITKEQREKINRAISNFIRPNNPNNGL
jgi:hypothetical protein